MASVSAHDSTAPSAPTLFISYSSDDRVAARRLRDAISARGIDVWYDEDELVGGDAWDQKIRDRIRKCDYFMPVISNSTERRREGYFRREWRQAAERTLDMADDVLFLLPVVIDPLVETEARVPERFQQVQWTRCPGGMDNAGLEEICTLMLHHESAHRAEATPPPLRPPRKAGKRRAALPPYPPQPRRAAGEPGWQHGVNLLVWAVRCGYRLFRSLPKIVRILLAIWLLLSLFRRGSDDNEPARAPDPTSGTVIDGATVKASGLIPVLSQAAQALQKDEQLGQLGRFVGAVAEAAQTGRPLALATFTTTDRSETAQRVAEAIFQRLLNDLGSAHPNQVAVSAQTLTANPAAAEVLGRMARLECGYLLHGWVETSAGGVEPAAEFLVFNLHAKGRPEPVWRERFPVPTSDAAVIVAQIEAAIASANVFTAAPVIIPEPVVTPPQPPAPSP